MPAPEPLIAEARAPISRHVPEGRRERIKVVFVIDNMRFGGTELNAVRTAERLDRERFDLRVVCLSGDGPLTERYRAIGVPVVNLGLRSFYGPSMFRCGWRFVRMLRRERADIVHAHDVYSNIFITVWGRLGGARVVITSRRWWNSLPNWKLRVGSGFAVARSTAILANSRAVSDLVVKEWPSAKRRVWTITNFVDDHAFGRPNDEERMRLRRGWGAPEDAVVLGCVARFDSLKDHPGLLQAFALLHARNPRTFLVLIGDGESRSGLERKVKQLGLEGVVHFAGEVRKPINLHRGFDISVLASTSEGFPNTLVEAMAAGNAVVATAVGGCVDAVVNESTGLLVPPSQPDLLADALMRVTGDAALRRSFGDAGLSRAAENFSAAAVVGTVEDMYRTLAQRVAQ
jgi:glycosyltransferase involved in cell wall biosynthesis